MSGINGRHSTWSTRFQEAVAELQQGDANVSGQMGIASSSGALLCLKIHVGISREVA